MYDICQGIKVLEVAGWMFVPAAGALLSDYGADVIKIEHPVGGDPMRGLSSSLARTTRDGPNHMIEVPNRGKRSVGLDIGHPRGLELLHQMAEKSDVFLTNFRQAARQKLKIDVEHIRAVNPDIIYARGSGYGQQGPEAQKGGYDFAAHWARSGFCYRLTTQDAEFPTFQPSSVGDLTGGLSLSQGILGALLKRERTGVPSVVDGSLLSTGIWMLGPVLGGAAEGQPDQPAASTRYMMNPVVGSYKTKDNRWLAFSMLQAGRDFPDLCKHIDRPELAEDPRFSTYEAMMEHKEELIRILDEVFAKRTLAEWREALRSTQGVWDPVQSPSEVVADPQTVANGFMSEVQVPGGDNFKITVGPIQFDEQPVGPLEPAPEAGQHTEEVLLELGLDWDEISECKQAKVIQ